MNNNRKRQFHYIRSQKLSDNNSQSSKSSFNLHSNFYNNTNISQKSSFLKKQQPDLCISCTNKYIASQKRQKIITDRIQQTKNAKEHYNVISNMKDPNQQKRSGMKKEFIQANKKIITQKINQIQSNKIMNKQYFQDMYRQQKQKDKLQKQLKAKRYSQALLYGKQLYKQGQLQRKKKKQEHKDILSRQNISLPIFYNDKSQIMQKYAKQLKNQMISKKNQIQINKKIQILQAKQSLLTAEKQFKKYYNLHKLKNQDNPQIFEEIKKNDEYKQFNKKKQRQQKEIQRKKQAQIQRQVARFKLQQQIQYQKKYIQQLRQQVNERKYKEQLLKANERSYKIKVDKYSQDVLNETKKTKPCNQCQINYQYKCFV